MVLSLTGNTALLALFPGMPHDKTSPRSTRHTSRPSQHLPNPHFQRAAPATSAGTTRSSRPSETLPRSWNPPGRGYT